MTLTLAIAGGILAYLLLAHGNASAPGEKKQESRPEETVQVAGPRSIRVLPDTALAGELHVATASTASLTTAILPVTGAAQASLRPGKELSQDAWQFATPDLLSAYTDWQKAVTDIRFQEAELKLIRDLNEARIDAQQKVVTRMEKLVAAGTDTQKDLVAEQATLIQTRIEGARGFTSRRQRWSCRGERKPRWRASFSRPAWNRRCCAPSPPRATSWSPRCPKESWAA